MKCVCGKTLTKTQKFCPECGKKVGEKEVTEVKEEKKEESCDCKDCKCGCDCKCKKYFIIAIAVLVVIALVEAFFLIKGCNPNSNKLKIKNNTWTNIYGSTTTEFKFNKDMTFNYTATGGGADYNLGGTYEIYKDFIVLYLEETDSYGSKYKSSYMLPTSNDYFCFNFDCDETQRFYNSKSDTIKEKIAAQKAKEELKNKEIEYIDVKEPTVYIFHGETCPHCAELFEWLETYKYKKSFKIVKYEVWNDANNAQLMSNVADYLEVQASGVPFVVIGNKVMSGFSATSSPAQFESMLDEAYENINNKKYYDVIKMVSE